MKMKKKRKDAVVSRFTNTMPRRCSPKDDVDTLWLVVEKVEEIWLLLHLLHLVLGQVHQMVNLLFEPLHALHGEILSSYSTIHHM